MDEPGSAAGAPRRRSGYRGLRLTGSAKPDRAELLAELEGIRAMAPAPKPGAGYPSAEQLIREDRDSW